MQHELLHHMIKHISQVFNSNYLQSGPMDQIPISGQGVLGVLLELIVCSSLMQRYPFHTLHGCSALGHTVRRNSWDISFNNAPLI